tara:strand:- start:224 stop:535 length:312 start_codon:yes stop_codon:yes gene_type:complete
LTILDAKENSGSGISDILKIFIATSFRFKYTYAFPLLKYSFEFLPDDSSQLIQVGGVAGWDEGRQIIQKFKKGKKSFKDFMGRGIGIDKRLKFKRLGEMDLVL